MLVYRDRRHDLQPGRPAAARRQGDHEDRRARGGGLWCPADLPLSSRFVHLLEHQPAGSYLAVLERSPFWDPGVSGVVERGSFHLVLGWPEGQP